MDTSASLALGEPMSEGEGPTMDLGRKRPTKERPPFFMVRPILRIIIEADDAVEEMEMLSVEAENIFPPE
jgi:hypothetical protein